MMKKFFAFAAAACCAMALSATTYTCHIKVVVNGNSTEQDEVPVVVTDNGNGTFDLSLNNFVLLAEGAAMPVGNIAVSGVEGVDEYGYTTIRYDAPLAITEGDDPQYDYWMGPLLGAVPVNLAARFTDTAASANIDINLEAMSQVISVSIFGVAPAAAELEGDVNRDGEVNVSDVNRVIDIILTK